MTNTALRAENSNSRTITFKSREHEKFYEEYLKKCRYQDVYHRALVYCLGIDRDTRNNVNKIYNFKTGCVKTECLQEGWQTSGSLRIVRMAFNLYCKRNKQAIKTTYGNDIKIFEQTIPRTESLAETASEGVSIFSYDGKSKGADSYRELVQEVLKHA